MTTCPRGTHGGYAVQAKRRSEEFLACGHCGGRSHPRHPVTFEPIRAGWRDAFEILAGLVIFGTLFLGVPLVLFLAGAA